MAAKSKLTAEKVTAVLQAEYDRVSSLTRPGFKGLGDRNLSTQDVITYSVRQEVIALAWQLGIPLKTA